MLRFGLRLVATQRTVGPVSYALRYLEIRLPSLVCALSYRLYAAR